MRNFFTTLLCLVFSIGAWAQTSGVCGDNLTWTIADNTLTISGTGAMWNWGYEESTGKMFTPSWASQLNMGVIQRIVINDGVTTIGKDAFGLFNSLTVFIPPSISIIKENAFCAEWSAVVAEYRAVRVIIQNSKPPLVESNVFNSLPTNSILKVPVNSVNTYKGANEWSEFTSISEKNSPDGICSENVTWKLDDTTGTLSFEGEGELRGYYFGENPPWYGFYFQTAIIGEGITAIGGNILNGKKLTTIYFNPINCTRMGDSTFPAIESLTQLSTLMIGDKVTVIPSYAFYRCDKLSSITIPESVSSIGEYAFYRCDKLSPITIPENVSSIGEYAFAGCNSLNTVNFNAINCVSGGFLDCTALEKVNIGAKVTNIPDGAFEGCHNLTSITIPNSVKNIGQKAFLDCRSLTSVVIPDNIKEIKEKTFSGCNKLKSVVIHNKIESIGASAFSNCDSLSEITSLNPMPPIAGSSFGNVPTATCLLKVPDRSKVAYQEASGWKEFINIIDNQPMQNPIGSYGDNLTWSLQLADSILSISGEGIMADYKDLSDIPWYLYRNSIKIVEIESGITSINKKVFANCSNFVSINVNTSSPIYTSLDGVLYDKEQSTLLLCPPAVHALTILESVTSLSSDAIYPSSKLKVLNYNAINCTEMGKVRIHGLPKLGGGYYFYSYLEACSNLEIVNIGNNVETIPTGAFSGLKNLKTVNFNAIDCTETGGRYYCDGILTSTCFRSIFDESDNLTEINIGNNVKRIPDNAFRGCVNLSSITIPESVSNIGIYAFYGCSALSDITSLNALPPTISNNNTFEGVDYKLCKLKVLAGHKSVYQAAGVWKEFTNISELPFVAEDIQVATENNSASVSWTASPDATNYTLSIYSDANGTEKIADIYLDNEGNILKMNKINHVLSCTISDLDLSTIYYYYLIAYNQNNAVIALSKGSFETKSESGIDESSHLSEALLVYPNPVVDSFRIVGISTNVDMTLFDINGKIVLQKTINPDEDVSIKNVPGGIYMIQVGEKTFRIIKY